MLENNLKALLEAILLAAKEPLTEEQLLNLFLEEERPTREALKATLQALSEESENRGVELVQVASGFRFQVKQKWVPWVSRLWQEKPQKYSRALLETLALIAYRQPITRGEIEDIRGVAVSSTIIKNLQEDREWIRVVGHKEVPGKPALYATTKGFLDYFGLKSLQELPTLPTIMNLDKVEPALEEKALSSDEVVAHTAITAMANEGTADTTVETVVANASVPEIEGIAEAAKAIALIEAAETKAEELARHQPIIIEMVEAEN